MSIEKEEPGLWVVYCDKCGERKVLDTDGEEELTEAAEEVEALGWEAQEPETVKFASDFSQSKFKITYFEHHCPDCV